MKEDEIQSATAITTAEYNVLKKKADILDFLFGEKGVRTENLMKIQIWREKAEKYDELVDIRRRLAGELLIADGKLEAVKDILKLPKCENADETPDIILGFEEQYYLKKLLGGKDQ